MVAVQVTELPVTALKPVAGAHAYVVPPVAVSVLFAATQNGPVGAALTPAVTTGLMVIACGVEVADAGPPEQMMSRTYSVVVATKVTTCVTAVPKLVR